MPERFQIMRNDVDRAQHFVDCCAEDLHYCHPWKTWYTWDGKRWLEDQEGTVLGMARLCAEDLLVAAEELADRDRHDAAVKNANAGMSLSKIKAAVELAATYPPIPILPRDFDTDPWSLNCKNGVLNLQTMALRPADRTCNMTKLVPHNYNPNATCPRFIEFMEEIMPDEETRSFLHRSIGYSLTGSVIEQVLFLLLGKSSNGKSTLVKVIGRVFGADYSIAAPPKLLTVRRNEATNDLMDLQGRRFVSCIESEQGEHLAEALVKTLTGSDEIRGRELYKNNSQFPPTHKLWLATNHAPVVHGEDQAMARRLRLITFGERFVDPEDYHNEPHTHIKDYDLEEKLLTESEGILAWAIEGCREWQRRGLGQPAQVERDTTSYLAEHDPIGRFIEDECEVGARVHDSLPYLYDKYKVWCIAQGMSRPWSKQAFSKSLVECHNCRKYPGRSAHGNRVVIINGIRWEGQS